MIIHTYTMLYNGIHFEKTQRLNYLWQNYEKILNALHKTGGTVRFVLAKPNANIFSKYCVEMPSRRQ